MSNEVPQYYKDEAYSLIRSIYKFIPFYNQIKGTYLGIQFMMNTMGLSAAIVELWSTRDDIKNFSKNTTLFREDELNAVRRFLVDLTEESEEEKSKIDYISDPAKVKDYYLTSTFDVDLSSQKGITFSEFNGMANTIISVIEEIKPVTRCLRKLYYLLELNTGLHFKYLFENQTTYKMEVGKTDDKSGISFKRFDYIWWFSEDPRTVYDGELNQLKTIFLSYKSILARVSNNAADGSNGKYTLLNTYNNLNNLPYKLKNSKVDRIKFRVYGRKNSNINEWFSNRTLIAIIGKDLDIRTDECGIYLDIINPSLRSILNLEYNIENKDLFLAIYFNIPLGTNYITQGNLDDTQNTVIYDWDIDDINDVVPPRGYISSGPSIE